MVKKPKVAILLPAFNEASTIELTIKAFNGLVPGTQIVVCDNNSSDGTAEIARRAGATVIHEAKTGKGYAVRRLFSEVDAEIYVLCDADLTYEAGALPRMIQVFHDENLDMLIGCRKAVECAAYPAGHQIGNRFFSGLFSLLYRCKSRDLFSGYRVMSKAFVKQTWVSRGFEIETELSACAAMLGYRTGEIETLYLARPAGSYSKLKTLRDGFRILAAMLLFRCKRARPNTLFQAPARPVAAD